MARWSGNPDFDLFRLPDEHNELRAVLRDLCDKEIAPYAADVDEHSRFPEEALKALTAADFSAVHVPEEYGGQGADAVATCIVIEEVARVDASASLIPGVNKLGTMGLILSGSEELKKQVLPALASGEALASYALSEREAGSDAASMRTRAKADDDDWILNGTKCWISNGGKSTWYTVMAVTDPAKGATGISAFMVHADDEGFSVGPKERKLGIKGSPTTELYFENCRIPGDRIIGEPAPASRPRWRRWTTPARRSGRKRSVSRRERSTRRSHTPRSASNSARRSATSRACSSCWPTWR